MRYAILMWQQEEVEWLWESKWSWLLLSHKKVYPSAGGQSGSVSTIQPGAGLEWWGFTAPMLAIVEHLSGTASLMSLTHHINGSC